MPGRFRHLLPLFVGALALVPLGGCGSDDSDPPGTLRVGVILPMTGDQATYGEESWNGISIALADLKKEGMPKVKLADGSEVELNLKLILRDEASKKQQAAANAKTLIESSEAHVLIGSVASSHSKAIFQEARESGVPCISPASTNDTLTIEGGEFTSRICYKDAFQGAKLAEFALGQGWKKAAVLIDKQQDYSVGLAANFRKAFEAGGGTASDHFYLTADTDFSNPIQSVASAGADVIFISGYYGQAGPMIKQAKEKWQGTAVIGGDGLDSPDFLKLLGDTSAEIYLSTHFAADAPEEHVRSFAKRYKDKYGKNPGAMAALGYDVIKVLVDAVKRAQDPFDNASLAKAIRETNGVEGITGEINLDNDERTPKKDLVILRVDGSFKFLKKLSAGK